MKGDLEATTVRLAGGRGVILVSVESNSSVYNGSGVAKSEICVLSEFLYEMNPVA